MHVKCGTAFFLVSPSTEGTKERRGQLRGTDRDPKEVGLVHGAEDDPAQGVVGVVEILDALVPAAGVQRLHGPLQRLGDDPDAIIGITMELAGPHARSLAVVLSLILLWGLEKQRGKGTKLQKGHLACRRSSMPAGHPA